jgi:hypothetical protein
LAAALLAILGGTKSLAEDRPRPVPVPETLITKETEAAIQRGLDFLAERQEEDGLWKESEYPTVISSLAGLALAARHPSRGPYRENVKKLALRLCSLQDRWGWIRQTDEERPAYAQGYAILFLTQVYGMLDKETNNRIAIVIRKGVSFICHMQVPKGRPAAGCWYQDYASGHNQIVTISQVQALRAANSTGFRVSGKVIENALRFMRPFLKTHNSAGRLASTVATLIASGDYVNPALPESMGMLVPMLSFKFRVDPFPMFTHLYASQSLYFWGGDTWEKYYKKVRNAFLACQRRTPTGSGFWPPFTHVHALRPGPVYSTSVACLILQMPLETLPFYQAVRHDLNLFRNAARPDEGKDGNRGK